MLAGKWQVASAWRARDARCDADHDEEPPAGRVRARQARTLKIYLINDDPNQPKPKTNHTSDLHVDLDSFT